MLVVTPNTCTDVTSWLPSLTPGTVSRSTRTAVSPGGKGVNVCRTLRALGHKPILIGLASSTDGRFEKLLEAEGCRFIPVHHSGDGRIALILLEDDGRVSVINGRGPTADQWDSAGFTKRVEAEFDGRRAVVCSGSLPPGLADDTYARITQAAHRRSLPAFLDAAPAVLGMSLSSQPDLVSPNLAEAEALLHGRVDEQVEESGPDVIDRCVDATRRLHDAGAVRAVVTAGSVGAAVTTASGSAWIPAAPVPVTNPIGAGDSFLAGTAYALVNGADDLEAVRYGMATAAAAVQHETGGMVDPALIEPARQRLGSVAAR